MLLIGFLAFFELVFISLLFVQVQQAEAEANTEQHYKHIIARTQALQQEVYQALESVKQYAITRDKSCSEDYDAHSKTVFETLDWLKLQLRQDKNCMVHLANVRNWLHTAFSTLSEARDLFDKSSSIQEAIDILNAKKNSFTKDFNKQLGELSSLEYSEREICKDIPKKVGDIRKRQRLILVIGVLINIVFVFVLFKFFTKLITSRLAVMADNTQRFKKGAELNAILPGNDEISALDLSFHDMAREVREAQQMRQSFVAMISHDLRTPLTNVSAYLSLVSEGILGEVPAKVKTGADKTEQSVNRLIRLINDLLVLEKMESGKLQMTQKIIYLEDIIEKSIEEIREFANTNGVKLDYEETNAEVHADPDRLIQVIINLASNAVKFSPKGETVTIKAIEHVDRVELQVIDRGRGVPPQYREIIFEKYKQVKAEDDTKKGGTGLGLPICKMIIEQMGGTIGVNSEEGKGSTFWFCLPRVDAQGAVIKVAQELPAERP